MVNRLLHGTNGYRMGNKIIVYSLLITGIIVVLVGIQSLYTFWGDVTFPGLTGQFTGVVCILGGMVNIGVSWKLKH
jgi:hypothetical protein